MRGHEEREVKTQRRGLGEGRYESHESRYMEALLNNISHYGEMFKTAHHLFSGGSVKVYTAFQCFLWVILEFC